MKRIFPIISMLMTIVMLCSCGVNEDVLSEEKQYIGNYMEELLYQKMIEIEDCVDPERLCVILENLYKEPIHYIEFESQNSENGFSGYKKPYDEFSFSICSLYDESRAKSTITSDTYAFFQDYSEIPLFVMDDDGAYLVSDYEVETVSEDVYAHLVTTWVATDLYMCHNGFINANEETVSEYKGIVEGMDFYMDFEEKLKGQSTQQNNGVGVTVSEAPEDFYNNPEDYIYFCEDGYSQETAFAPRDALLSTDVDVKNLVFFSVDFNYDDMTYSISEVLYTKEVFSAEEKIVLGVDVGEVVSMYGISYDQSDATTKRFVIGESGEDGSLYMSEF